jgi:hypothetical protein
MARDKEHGGPGSLTTAERAARLRRARSIARRLGFSGHVEYRHVFSGSGGAQFGLGSEIEQDLIVVYAEAFLRDADADDFSLEAIIAHELGHQVVCRNRRLQQLLAGRNAPATEEILASLVGSLLADRESDRQSLVLKGLDEAVQCGMSLTEATEMVVQLRKLVEGIL